ncbi:MAG: hypothetical protein ABIR30_02010 [Chitinophagaceae bacterium]
MRIVSALVILLALFLSSCQKELNWDDGSNGDLLVKAIQVTPATNDTNTITFQWDNARRLLLYKSTGKVNGTTADISHQVIRYPDGTIKKIITKSAITAAFIDSVVSVPVYSASRLSYVIDTQYTLIGQLRDSIAFSYNPSGYVSEKETFTNILGTPISIAKETYAYDANGNLTERKVYTPDGVGGYTFTLQTKFTYDTHKSAAFMGEESYIGLGAENVSKNFLVQSITDDVIGSTSYSTSFTQTSFNDYNRPAKSTLTLIPNPPGYEMKLFYSYI